MSVQQKAESIIAQAAEGGGYVTLQHADWDALVEIIRRGYRKGGCKQGVRQPRSFDTLQAVRGDCSLYSRRENEIAKLIRAGKSNLEIAAQLGITQGTVKVTAQHIKAKWATYQWQQSQKEVA